jgi:hypothetical protein
MSGDDVQTIPLYNCGLHAHMNISVTLMLSGEKNSFYARLNSSSCDRADQEGRCCYFQGKSREALLVRHNRLHPSRSQLHVAQKSAQMPRQGRKRTSSSLSIYPLNSIVSIQLYMQLLVTSLGVIFYSSYMHRLPVHVTYSYRSMGWNILKITFIV